MLTLIITIGIVHFFALMTPGPDFLFVSQTAASRSRTDAMFGVLGIVTGVAFWAGLTLVGLEFVFERFVWLPRLIQLFGGIYLLFLGYILLLAPSKKLSAYVKSTNIKSNTLKNSKLNSGPLRKNSYTKTDNPLSKKQNLLVSETDDSPFIAGLREQYEISSQQISPARTNNTFLFGLLTNISNPKVIIYFGSVFAPFLGNPDRLSGLIKWELLMLIVMETFIWFTIVALIFGLPKMQKLYRRFSIWLDALAGIFFAGFGSHLIFTLKITSLASIFNP